MNECLQSVLVYYERDGRARERGSVWTDRRTNIEAKRIKEKERNKGKGKREKERGREGK